MKNIERETSAIVDNWAETIIWYLNELQSNEKKIFSEKVKVEFCKMVDEIQAELESEENEDEGV